MNQLGTHVCQSHIIDDSSSKFGGGFVVRDIKVEKFRANRNPKTICLTQTALA